MVQNDSVELRLCAPLFAGNWLQLFLRRERIRSDKLSAILDHVCVVFFVVFWREGREVGSQEGSA